MKYCIAQRDPVTRRELPPLFVEGEEVTPGLAIRQEPEDDGGWWKIDHTPSGSFIGEYATRQEALDTIRALAPLADWTSIQWTVSRGWKPSRWFTPENYIKARAIIHRYKA